MPQAEARAWWADVEHLRERIERRRELEGVPHDAAVRDGAPGEFALRDAADIVHDAELRTSRARTPRGDEHPLRVAGEPDDGAAFRPRRTVRIRGQAIPTVVAPRLQLVEDAAPLPPALPTHADDAVDAAPPGRRRPRPRPAERVGPNPDRLALWAVVLGIVLVLAALLSAHGL